MDIPILDISDFQSPDARLREQTVRAWRDALDAIGFVVINGHGIAQELIDKVYAAGRGFFAQPVERKLAYSAARHGSAGRAGYIGLYGESVGKASGTSQHADVSESFTFTQCAPSTLLPKDVAGPANIWPAEPDDFREIVEQYADQACALGMTLMRISALALDLPEDHFDPFYAPMLHRLRLAYYPDQKVEPEPGQIRKAPHTDFAGFTILLPDDAPGGLQVLANGEWIDVPTIPGTLIINTGDLIQRWTNDRWISNVHRVINPPRDRAQPADRLSLVIFTGPSLDSEISCLPTCCSDEYPPRYPTVRASEHIGAKLAATHEKAAAA